MHFNVGSEEEPEWRTVRGTSLVESWHSRYHYLLEGFSYTPEYFVFVSNLAIIDWNNGIGVRCLRKTDYGVLDTCLLRRNNTLYKLVGKEIKYTDAVVLYARTPELFHFEWRRLTGSWGAL